MPTSDWLEPAHWPGDLRDAFAEAPRDGCWHLALSGGLDSVFLLYCLTALARKENRSVTAVHVNHGLQPEAAEWEKHCRTLCHSLGVGFLSQRVDLDPKAGDLEASARRARYDVFETVVAKGDALFMAHHGDDQAETVLLRLLRGSGVRGLAGMPAMRALGAGWLCRPLLTLTRERIAWLARQWRLHWCEDGSNQELRFDRNYLRHRVMPVLRQRWPETVSGFNRSARHCREADQLLGDMASQDAESVDCAGAVAVNRLAWLGFARRKQLMRHLLWQNGLPVPGEQRLGNGLEALINTPGDGSPELTGPGYRIRRYRDCLWVLPDLPGVPVTAERQWHPRDRLDWWGTTLRTCSVAGEGLAGVCDGGFTVTRRRGGERIRPGAGQPQRTLKKWLQECGVPPWERQYLPLIWSGGVLVAVADYWVAPHWRARPGDNGWQPVWDRPWRLLHSH